MEGTTYPRMNRVFLTGIAQEEPELRFTPSGVNVCSFRVQVGRILRDRSGGSREVAAYLTVVAWQEAAQRLARELRKGQAIYVEGYLSSRSFTTARGDKRTAVEVYAEQVQILGPFAEEGGEETVAAASAGTGRRSRQDSGAAKHEEKPAADDGHHEDGSPQHEDDHGHDADDSTSDSADSAPGSEDQTQS